MQWDKAWSFALGESNELKAKIYSLGRYLCPSTEGQHASVPIESDPLVLYWRHRGAGQGVAREPKKISPGDANWW